MKPPIYKPSGAALEYGDLALNIYTGCNHGCYYCFAPNVLHKTREAFAKVEPRKLNYHPSSINWHDFGHAAEEICKRRGLDYYIKDSLRADMEKTT